MLHVGEHQQFGLVRHGQLGAQGSELLSTSKGVMSGGNAKRQKLGGELLANVW
jgi:ribosomal protein S8